MKEYVFEIGGKEQILQVPAEFDFDTLIAQKFAGIESLRDLPLIVAQDQGFTGNRLKLSEKNFKKVIWRLHLIFFLAMHFLLIV